MGNANEARDSNVGGARAFYMPIAKFEFVGGRAYVCHFNIYAFLFVGARVENGHVLFAA